MTIPNTVETEHFYPCLQLLTQPILHETTAIVQFVQISANVAPDGNKFLFLHNWIHVFIKSTRISDTGSRNI